jgi:hypothetical protein
VIAIVVAVVVVAGGVVFFLLHKSGSGTPLGDVNTGDLASPITNPDAHPVQFQLRSSNSVRSAATGGVSPSPRGASRSSVRSAAS